MNVGIWNFFKLEFHYFVLEFGIYFLEFNLSVCSSTPQQTESE